MLALAHGTNDAQKTMGVITLALVANGSLSSDASVPTWVVIAAASAIALGTYTGGWRIIKTMGTRIIKMDAAQGFSAQGAGAAVILASSHFGFPLSTTQVIAGGVMGAGAGKRLSAVRWGVAGNIVAAWLLTLPAAAAIGGLVYLVTDLFPGALGPVLVSAVGIALVVVAFTRRIRRGRPAPDLSNAGDDRRHPRPLADDRRLGRRRARDDVRVLDRDPRGREILRGQPRGPNARGIGVRAAGSARPGGDRGGDRVRRGRDDLELSRPSSGLGRLGTVRVARNIAIIALLALIVALVPGGGNAADAIVSAVGIVFLAMIAYTAYRVFRENQYAYLSLDDRHRAMLVIAVGAIVLMIAAADELTRTGLGLIVWLGVLAAAIWAMVIVYQDSRSY